MAEKILVGTSAWHYDHWKGPFYPEHAQSGELLHFYTRRFSTVEINNSFYHLPSQKTFAAWRDATPAGFIFAVKASRYITHMKKLKDPEKALEKFLSCAEGLGNKLGPILFQLPPRWNRNAERLHDFLSALPGNYRYAFELRDPDWLHEEIFTLLEKRNCALCLFDFAGQKSLHRLTADFAYIRLHGPSHQKYAGRYTKAQLRQWLGHAEKFLQEGAKQVFIYFNNDQQGYAALNALEIKEMAGRTLSR